MDSNSLPMRLRKTIVEFDLEGAPRGAVGRFCQANGISRSVFYKIRARAKAQGAPARAPLPASRAPKSSPSRTDPDVEALAVRTRLDLKAAGWDCGPVSVRDRLIRAGVKDVPSRATLARLFARNGLVTPEPSKRPRASYKRFAHQRANDLWQLDGTEWRLDDERNTRQVVYQVEDDHSRMILAWAIDATENGATAVDVVSRAIRAHGAPVRFLTDNAMAFNQSRRGSQAPLERYLLAFGVKPISGQVAKPTTQGKNERLHRTLQQFLQAHRPITTPDQLRALLEEFADGYNNHRPHQELPDRQTPAEAYAAAVKADPPTPPPPAQQDLFEAAGDPAQHPARPRRNKPRGAYQIGGLTMIDRPVSKEGCVSVSRCLIYVGAPRAGQTLRVTVTDDRLELFAPDGEHIGVITLPPPTGKPAYLNLFTHGLHTG
jgi:transposase InsO family protein